MHAMSQVTPQCWDGLRNQHDFLSYLTCTVCDTDIAMHRTAEPDRCADYRVRIEARGSQFQMTYGL